MPTILGFILPFDTLGFGNGWLETGSYCSDKKIEY